MKEFYAEREQVLPSIKFSGIKKAFLHIYNQFLQDGFFDKKRVVWTYQDPELFLFQKLGMWDIWPFEQKIETYNETTLFSVIEFLYESFFNEKITLISEDFKNGKIRYRNQINDILRFYNGGYKLSEDGKIQKLSPPGFETLMGEVVETNDPKNIDLKIKYAILSYSHYNSSIEDKEAALLKLSGVLEFLQKQGIKLPTDDDKDLFIIMNKFNLRHKNRSQHSQYKEDIWYDWMFYTFLASIHVLLKLNGEKFDLKIKHAE